MAPHRPQREEQKPSLEGKLRDTTELHAVREAGRQLDDEIRSERLAGLIGAVVGSVAGASAGLYAGYTASLHYLRSHPFEVHGLVKFGIEGAAGIAGAALLAWAGYTAGKYIGKQAGSAHARDERQYTPPPAHRF